MSEKRIEDQKRNLPKLKMFPAPAKALVSAVILTMTLALTGALGQIIVHDIIPTFFSDAAAADSGSASMPGMQASMAAGEEKPSSRGDLLAGEESMVLHEEMPPFYESERFVWILKWTHIHLFGMNAIFIVLGIISIFLDLSARTRTWLVVLPFLGVFIDIAAMWLKAFVSPAFFWLHIPGGGLFGLVFIFVNIRALLEMWGPKPAG